MTADKNDTKTKILDAAEGFIVQGGYNAFSFRDIAEAVGIKSASAHYHYPTKGDLVAAVMARYTELFAQLLPNPNDESLDPKTLLNGFINGFKTKIVDQRNMSICTVLAADRRLLPEEVCNELSVFYQQKLIWLSKVFVRLNQTDEDTAFVSASQLLACLHGASILVQGTNQPVLFDHALSDWRERYGK